MKRATAAMTTAVRCVSTLLAPLALLCLLCAGCASVAIDEAEQHARAGDYESAYATLQAAAQAAPDDAALHTAEARARDRVIVRALASAELALAAGRSDEAERLVERARRLDAAHPRLAPLLAEAQRLRGQREQAARLAQLAQRQPAPPPKPTQDEAAPALGPAFQKPVSLEFRDAPLRQVFESLARTSGVNFVFDKDVRTDSKVSVFLRGVSLDEAVRVMLTTQQLDRRLLNDSTLLIYPATAAKQREYQELVTRSLYLVNADVKQVLTLVRTMAKTRDLYADERLNALVLRDTPEVVRLVEKLVATIDLPEPEVMLAVEVLEVASDKLDQLGLSWPEQLQFGLPGVIGQVPLSSSNGFRGSVANPAFVATLLGNRGSANLLANPTIRARNHEKARVQIGEKLPVFSTTSATVNVGASTAVTYLDVGIKLDVEPSVQLDGDVTIKVALEVSNLLREVSGPAGSLAYQVGTRLTTTSLRLKDGQTQVLAGLINDEDRKRAVGLPVLSALPLLGRLFGVHDDTRNKTEIVMLITPRIVRSLPLPDVAAATLAAGTDAMPGAAPLRLQRGARAGVAAGSGVGGGAGGAGGAAQPPADAPAAGTQAAPSGDSADNVLLLAATPQAAVGDTVSVTLSNRSGAAVRGELQFDASQLQAAASGADATPGRLAFSAGPRGDAVLVLRVLPAAAGNSVAVSAVSISASTPAGDAVALRVEGDAVVQVRPAAAEPK